MSNPKLQMNSMKEDLQDVTAEHLSEFYKDYINENSNDVRNEMPSTFSRVFVIISLVLEGDEGVHHKFNERSRYLHRILTNHYFKQSNLREKQLRRTGTSSIAISFVNAEVKGYAVYNGNATTHEKEAVSKMATLAFMGRYHNLYIEKLQASANKLIAATVQISTAVMSESTSNINNEGIGGISFSGDEGYKSGHYQDNGNGSYIKSKEYVIRWKFILFFVLGCFTVGALVGTFVIYYVSRYLKADDDNTEETSKDSLTGLSSMKIRYRSREYKKSKPAESISVGVDDDGNDVATKRENESKLNDRILSHHYQIMNNVRKKKKKRSPHKRRTEKKSAPEMNLTSIEEESDGDLYIDFIDDIVIGQMRKKGSLFPTLQDRLSNVKSKHLGHQSNFPSDYNELYTPARCTTLYETSNIGDNLLRYSNMVSSDILIPSSFTEAGIDVNEEKDSKNGISSMIID